jgi:hypothetical protein
MAAGDPILASDFTGRGRIGTSLYDTDSATFTTSALEVASVSGSLVSGRTYRIRLLIHIGSTTTDSTVTFALKEDSSVGTDIQGHVNVPVPTATAAGHYYEMATEYTAVATGSKTFSATAVRATGTGTLRREAASIRPTIFTVEYAYG